MNSFSAPFEMHINLLKASCQFYDLGNVFLKDVGTIPLKCNYQKGQDLYLLVFVRGQEPILGDGPILGDSY